MNMYSTRFDLGMPPPPPLTHTHTTPSALGPYLRHPSKLSFNNPLGKFSLIGESCGLERLRETRLGARRVREDVGDG